MDTEQKEELMFFVSGQNAIDESQEVTCPDKDYQLNNDIIWLQF